MDSLNDFFKNHYKDLFDPDDLEKGAFGEACDVAGNFLPAGTLTSVGVMMDGEEFPELIKHLHLDATDENEAIIEQIIEEGSKVGLEQFIRHSDPSPYKIESWRYLRNDHYDFYYNVHKLPQVWWHGPKKSEVERIFSSAFMGIEENMVEFENIIEKLKKIPRNEYDKLPNQFEFVSGFFEGTMSFRGWRDLHRQGFSTHLRTYLTPEIGFYRYDKPAPDSFREICKEVSESNKDIWGKITDVETEKKMSSLENAQYPLALGNLVGFQIGGNLSQFEFVNWQRTKRAVNHEVRQVVITMEQRLRESYPWWGEISRANIIRKYIFARTKKEVVLEEEPQ